MCGLSPECIYGQIWSAPKVAVFPPDRHGIGIQVRTDGKLNIGGVGIAMVSKMQTAWLLAAWLLAVLSCVPIFLFRGLGPASISAEKALPSCGAVLFLHINKAGGGSTNEWLSKQAGKHLRGFCCTSRKRAVEKISGWWPKYEKELDDLCNSVAPNEWKAATLHHGFPGLAYIHNTSLPRWRTVLEDQGCKLVVTTILRHPLERLLSNLDFNHVQDDDVEAFVQSRSNWLSRYLLYNLCRRIGPRWQDIQCGYQHNSSWMITPQSLDDRLYTWLDTFDVIGFTDRMPSFQARVAKFTGWSVDDRVAHSHARVKGKMKRQYNETLIKLMLNVNREDERLYHHYREADLYKFNPEINS